MIKNSKNWSELKSIYPVHYNFNVVKITFSCDIRHLFAGSRTIKTRKSRYLSQKPADEMQHGCHQSLHVCCFMLILHEPEKMYSLILFE